MPTPHTAAEQVAALLAEHDLDEPFPPDVIAEAEAHVASPGTEDPGLRDLRHLPFCTIDEVSSRDLDQALCIEADGEQLVAWYAIADAAHYVPLGSALFREALRRGATAYLPGHVVPMLPKSLSEGVVSLNPGVDRRALVWRMVIEPDGRCSNTTIRPGRIRSRAKLAYDHVQAWLDGGPAPTSDEAVLHSLQRLPRVGERRIDVAEEHGVVRYRRRELAVNLDPAGLRFVAQADDRNDVERFNEQLSLLCNVQGAQQLARDGESELVQPIYRVHEPPEAELLARLEAQLATLGRLRGLDPATWGWTRASGQSLATFLDRLPREGAEGRLAHAIHRQAVLMNRAASYRAAPGPHHGVGAALYGRFSAPMREVVGVFLHQELAEQRAGVAAPLPPPFASADELREAVIEAAARARARQRILDRELNRMALDHLFESPPEELRATVMGVSKGRVHLQLLDPPIDAKVYFAHARERVGPLRVDDLGLAALRSDGTPWVAVGDTVRVTVRGRDEARNRWALDLHPES